MILHESYIHLIVLTKMNCCLKSGTQKYAPNSRVHAQVLHWVRGLSFVDFPYYREEPCSLKLWLHKGRTVMSRNMNRCSQRRTTVARDRGRPLGLATATGLRADRARPCQPLLSRASVHETRSRAQAQRARKFARAFWWRARTASTTPPGLSERKHSSTEITQHFWRDKFLLTWPQRAFTTCPQLHRNLRTQRILSKSRASTQPQ